MLLPRAALRLEEVVADRVDRHLQPGVGDLTLDLGQFGVAVGPEIIEQFDAARAILLLLRRKLDEARQVDALRAHG